MIKAKSSEIQLSTKDASKVLAMVKRGDRKHDIAAWFGVNQGRIADAEKGKYGTLQIYNGPDELFPSGSPGIKARRLIQVVDQVHDLLTEEGKAGVAKAIELLESGLKKFNKNE
jgi:hypothetical protein